MTIIDIRNRKTHTWQSVDLRDLRDLHPYAKWDEDEEEEGEEPSEIVLTNGQLLRRRLDEVARANRGEE